jgi:signal transduction histidine kinase
MRPKRAWSGASRTLAVRLLAVVVPPAVMLVWLGLQLLQQDRSLLAQRERERLGAASLAAVHALDATLADVERQLPEGAVPAGTARFTFNQTDMKAEPAGAVAWLPAPPAMPAAESALFAPAETLEFRGAAAEALSSYRQMAGSRDSTVRAGALLRAARVLRNQRRWDEALETYRRLGDIRGVAVASAPADLQARRAACAVLEEAGRRADLARAAASLEADLVGGRWALDDPAWERTITDVERWLGRPVHISAERALLSSAAAALWEERQLGTWPPAARSGRRLVDGGGDSVTIVWLTNAQVSQVAALAIPPSVLRTWAARADADRANTGDRLSVIGPEGQLLAGTAPAADPAALRAQASDTRLPWTLVLTPGPVSPVTGELASRRRLLSVGLVAILMLLGGGSYFLWRVINRELVVVRQQRDFVSAVSHEFRTPLTSLRHVTELLQENDEVPLERRREFYEAMGRNTERLHRLVESLLDFSRMEGGKKPYDLQPLDAGELAGRVAADFQQETGPRGVIVHLDVEDDGPLRVRADRAALANAIWNLLDNAVKYSPGAHDVHLSVARQQAGVAIAVRDEGLGIPAHERKDVFRRFVRGAQASRLGITGTGLGLAIVSHIVAAHGGSLELESEEGAGSTFRVVLPALH